MTSLSRAALCKRRDALRHDLAKIRAMIHDVDARANKERLAKRRKKLQATIRELGGKETFIARYGQGKFRDFPRLPGYCAENTVFAAFFDECELLGVVPNRARHWCSFRATVERDGMPVCRRHAKMIDESQCGNWRLAWDWENQSSRTE